MVAICILGHIKTQIGNISIILQATLTYLITNGKEDKLKLTYYGILICSATLVELDKIYYLYDHI